MREINNEVKFEAHADIACARPGLSPRETDFLLSQVMTAIHNAIVGGLGLAVDFPAMTSMASGGTLRVIGSRKDVDAVIATPVLMGLAMAGIIQVGKPAAVPATAEGVTLTRLRIDKFTKGGLARLDKRTNKRRRSGKCVMEADDLERRRDSFLSRGKALGSVPAIPVKSGSTGEGFLLYLAARTAPVQGSGFNGYGLSNGKGSVPRF